MTNNNKDISLDMSAFGQEIFTENNAMFTFVSKQETKAFNTKIKPQKVITPKQEARIMELEECVRVMKLELTKLEDSNNYSDITMYKMMIKEYKDLIYNLKNQ